MKEKPDSIDRLCDAIEEVANNYHVYLDRAMFSVDHQIYAMLIRMKLRDHGYGGDYCALIIFISFSLGALLMGIGAHWDIFSLIIVGFSLALPFALWYSLLTIVPLAYLFLIRLPMKFSSRLRARNISKGKARTMAIFLHTSIILILALLKRSLII